MLECVFQLNQHQCLGEAMPKNTLELKGTCLAIISGLLYSLLGFFGMSLKHSGLSVYDLSFWRFLTSSVFLLLILLCCYKNTSKQPKARSLMVVFGSGVVFYSPCGIFFFLASEHIGTGQSMVVFFIYPVFVMILGWILGKTKPKTHYLYSFIIIIIGLIFLVDISEISYDMFGISLSLASAILYAFYIFLSKRIILSPLLSSLMISLGCCGTSLILAIADHSLSLPLKLDQWLHIAGIGIICSALAILLLLEALKYISADQASLLSVLEPVFAVILGVILLDEALSTVKILGILLILLGAISVMLKKRTVK